MPMQVDTRRGSGHEDARRAWQKHRCDMGQIELRRKSVAGARGTRIADASSTGKT